ncbi:MAG: TetR/AcrR family transcriptional regulator [Syntrophales bacterium]|nr:TetR/AcrR family transcriptional regulator [Syntrophales bacterium]
MKKTAGKNNKNGSGTDSRKQLLDVALHLFAQKGYAPTTVREICDAAGTTAPSLYYYFGNKEGLYMELMQTHCAQIDALMETYAYTSESAKSRLKDLVDRIFRQVIEDKDFFRLMFTIYYGPPQGAPFCDFIYYHVKFHGAIRRIIEEGIASREVQPGNAGTMTWIIRGAVQLAMEEQIKDDREKIDRKDLQQILDFILDRFERPSKLPSGE